MTRRAKQLVEKMKNAGFWQHFSVSGRVKARREKSRPTGSDARERRAHEHPKEPERNKK